MCKWYVCVLACVYICTYAYMCMCVHTASSRDNVIYVMLRQKKILPRMNLKRLSEFKHRWRTEPSKRTWEGSRGWEKAINIEIKKKGVGRKREMLIVGRSDKIWLAKFPEDYSYLGHSQRSRSYAGELVEMGTNHKRQRSKSEGGVQRCVSPKGLRLLTVGYSLPTSINWEPTCPLVLGYPCSSLVKNDASDK